MLCPRCRTQNPDDASFCRSCGGPLIQSAALPPGPPPPAGRTSGMAIASLVLGLLSLVLVLPALLGLGLGVIALIQIGESRGRLRGRGLAIVGMCISGLALLILPAMLFPVFMRARESARKVQCLANTMNLATALLIYASEYDGVLPPAQAWCDAASDYLQGPRPFVCPNARELRSGYAYNSAVAGLSRTDLADPAGTIAIFESERGWNAAGGPELLVATPRHLLGDNFGLADGHTNWLPRRDQAQLKWQAQ